MSSQPGSGMPPAASLLIEHARRACLMHRVSFEGTDPQSVRVPADAVEELLQSLAGTIAQSVQQLVPFAPGARQREAFSGVIWRQLAQRCKVERYYLVPAGEENLRQADLQARQDEADGLRSEPVPVMGWSQLPQVPMNNLWLIDNRVVIRQEIGGAGLPFWLVSGHAREVEQAQRMLDAVQREHLERRARTTTGPDLTDTLLESAQILYTVARMSCAGSQQIDETGCGWYHGAWQYLRLFDMVSSPSWHAEFYTAGLRDRITGGARRILISGTADYTTLAFVLDAVKAAGRDPDEVEIHVLDRCQTPLLACQWYAGRLGTRVETHNLDITDRCSVAALGAFDLIVADAFLTRFGHEMVSAVVESWYRLLRGGGTILTTVRLHPRNDYRVHDATDLAANDRYRVTDPTDDFELRLRERATGWRGMLSIGMDELSNAGRQYAMRMKSNDLGDIPDITKIFEQHKFVVSDRRSERVQGELIGTEYLRIAAARPAS